METFYARTSPVYDATVNACIGYQGDARRAAKRAARAMRDGNRSQATMWQISAAWAAKEARDRLCRLVGSAETKQSRPEGVMRRINSDLWPDW